MQYVDIPKEQVIAGIKDKIIEETSKTFQSLNIGVQFTDVEWTENGLRLWYVDESTNNNK